MQKLTKHLFTCLATIALLFVQQQVNAAENVGVLSEKVYNKLVKAQDALTNKNYSVSLRLLEDLEKTKKNDYESALVYQTFGFLYAEQGDKNKAVDYFKRCLDLNALPDLAQQNMLYSLAGLYTDLKDYRNVINIVQKWLNAGATPTPDILIIMASAYYELSEYRASIPWIKKAIAAKSPAKDSYYSLLISAYFESKDYAGARGALHEMISRNPDNLKYWKLLAGAYQQENDELSGLAVLTVAHKKGLLNDDADILNLVKRNMYLGMPYEGATLLETEINRGKLPNNKDNLTLLVQGWTDAREFEKSLSAIDKLSALTGSGAYQVTKAQIYYERGQWQNVIDASNSAISQGGSKNPGEPHLLKGMAFIELQNYDAALPALEEAKKFSSTRNNASSWIGFINEERKLIADLAKAELADKELDEVEAEKEKS